MDKINFPDKSRGDQLTSNDVNEIKNVVNSNSDSQNSLTSSETPPDSPNIDDLWFDSLKGKLFIYYNDGNTSQWVEVSSAI